MDLVDLIESKRFLGSEFLLWLWFRSEQNDGQFDLGGDTGALRLFFDDQLVLEAYLAEAEQSRISGGIPTGSPEARSALRAGKRVAKAKLRLLQGDREWIFTVSAADFTFGSVKVPAILKGNDEKVLERLDLVEQLGDLWSALYARFLEDRLGRGWDATRRELTAWAREEA